MTYSLLNLKEFILPTQKFMKVNYVYKYQVSLQGISVCMYVCVLYVYVCLCVRAGVVPMCCV